MPKFIPQHTPSGLDNFTESYFAAMEWLLPEDIDRDKIVAFSWRTIRRVESVCRKFQRENTAALEEFYAATGGGPDLAGFCFFLNRNGHGTGFWDRDAGECGEVLNKASHKYGETCESITKRGRIISE